MNKKYNNQENNSLTPIIKTNYSIIDIEQAKNSGNNLDTVGKIFRKTKDGRPCYYSELSYFETNDL